eukprot:15468427-Alexandrium_andersonii.AAC.1
MRDGSCCCEGVRVRRCLANVCAQRARRWNAVCRRMQMDALLYVHQDQKRNCDRTTAIVCSIAHG